jgi:hypothetical protein
MNEYLHNRSLFNRKENTINKYLKIGNSNKVAKKILLDQGHVTWLLVNEMVSLVLLPLRSPIQSGHCLTNSAQLRQSHGAMTVLRMRLS